MLPFHTLDVFTDTPYRGNPLAVVLDADGLDTARMLTIAREFNLSETIFVRRPANAEHAAEVRIFFPTAEIPFAGHPTIGCAVLLAEMRLGTGDWETEIVLEEQAGLVPVRVTRADGRTRAEFATPVIPHDHPGRIDIARLAPALGLDADEIGFGRHAPGLWAGGPAFLYVPVASRAALAKAAPREPDWSAVMAAGEVDAAYLYTPGDGPDFRSRMFSPGAGIHEDPATGSATAILAAQLLAAGALAEGSNPFALLQGAEMGRPSDLGLTVEVRDGAVTQVRVAGGAVRISEGRIAPPQG